jgi:hypothetical protein
MSHELADVLPRDGGADELRERLPDLALLRGRERHLLRFGVPRVRDRRPGRLAFRAGAREVDAQVDQRDREDDRDSGIKSLRRRRGESRTLHTTTT